MSFVTIVTSRFFPPHALSPPAHKKNSNPMSTLRTEIEARKETCREKSMQRKKQRRRAREEAKLCSPQSKTPFSAFEKPLFHPLTEIHILVLIRFRENASPALSLQQFRNPKQTFAMPTLRSDDKKQTQKRRQKRRQKKANAKATHREKTKPHVSPLKTKHTLCQPSEP